MVIHDVKRTDREVLMKKEFSEQGIEEHINMPAVFLNKTCDGIANAHMNCVKHAMALDWDYCLIMEDDVKFTRLNAFSDFLKLIPKYYDSFDILLAGAYQMEVITKGPEIILTRRFSGLHCYVVNKRYYNKFIQCPSGVHIDRWLGGRNQGNATTIVANPFLAIQYPGYSDNAKKEIDWTSMVRNYLPKQ